MTNLRRTGTSALAVLALAGCDVVTMLHGFPEPRVAVQGALPIELPYRTGKGGVVILSGRVNGRADVDFILDTGAPVTVLIDGEKTTSLGFDTTKARPLGPADDPASPIGVVQPGLTVAFGGVTLTGLSAAVLPEKSLACPEKYQSVGFAGVIGADLFRRFVVEVDPVAGRVRLHDPAAWRTPDGAVAVPIRFDNGHPFIETRITLPSGATLALPMHMDTGMNAALALVAGSHPALAMPVDGEVTKACYVGGIRDVRSGPPVAVAIGGAQFADVRPSYSPKGDRPAVQQGGAVGSGLLSLRRYAIDYPQKRLVFLPAGS